jgi:hypothetical protein
MKFLDDCGWVIVAVAIVLVVAQIVRYVVK